MILPTLRISPKRRVPALYIGSRGLFPHEYLSIAWKMRGWQLKEVDQFTAQVTHGDDELTLSKYHAGSIICEWKDWERYYLPSSGLAGKTVLDVGAGCGETSYFFFHHGASSVIAVESDSVARQMLKLNAERNGWDREGRHLKVLPRAFELSDLLNEHFDFAKFDIEGGEAQLLTLREIDFPIVLEVHGARLRDQFAARFGLRLLARSMPFEDVWYMGNDQGRRSRSGQRRRRIERGVSPVG